MQCDALTRRHRDTRTKEATMTERRFIPAALIAALVAVAGAQYAGAAPALEVKKSGDIQYVSGGAGDEEQRALKETAPKDFNLEVTVAVASGNYLSDVDLALLKSGTEVLRTKTDGPIFLAKVPPGRYEVRATANGKTQSKSVDVGADKRASAVFHLGQLEQPDPPVAR
jgi:hypothetical protein